MSILTLLQCPGIGDIVIEGVDGEFISFPTLIKLVDGVKQSLQSYLTRRLKAS